MSMKDREYSVEIGLYSTDNPFPLFVISAGLFVIVMVSAQSLPVFEAITAKGRVFYQYLLVQGAVLGVAGVVFSVASVWLLEGDWLGRTRIDDSNASPDPVDSDGIDESESEAAPAVPDTSENYVVMEDGAGDSPSVDEDAHSRGPKGADNRQKREGSENAYGVLTAESAPAKEESANPNTPTDRTMTVEDSESNQNEELTSEASETGEPSGEPTRMSLLREVAPVYWLLGLGVFGFTFWFAMTSGSLPFIGGVGLATVLLIVGGQKVGVVTRTRRLSSSRSAADQYAAVLRLGRGRRRLLLFLYLGMATGVAAIPIGVFWFSLPMISLVGCAVLTGVPAALMAIYGTTEPGVSMENSPSSFRVFLAGVVGVSAVLSVGLLMPVVLLFAVVSR